MSKEYPRNQLCPCGSGKKYKICCAKKGFKFALDDQGNVERIVPMTRAAHEILEKQECAFRAKFGRERADDEPIFFDPEADTPKPMCDLAKMRRDIGEVARTVGIRKELVYAINETGIILTSENRDLFPDDAVQEFEHAVQEYRVLFGDEESDESPALPEATAFPNETVDAEVRRVLCNPLHALRGVMRDVTWIGTAKLLIEREGPDQFFVNMLHVLREELMDVEEGGEGPRS
ncbi:MAG TPA: SEC-C domain-containing protein [Anaeromyxobacteraceae bacterium]|nr:SEC-C domain-containing protein [Anaeromyxobacteraceae bacterium]